MNASNSNKLFIVVLNWNGWIKNTKSCIESLLKQDFDEYCIVLVDNNSNLHERDEIRRYSKQNFKLTVVYDQSKAQNGGTKHFEDSLAKLKGKDKLVVIENESNLGFAAGNNVGVKYAIRSGAKYVMLLNNDTIAPNDSVRKLFHFAINNQNIAAVAPQIRYYEAKDRIWNCGGELRYGIFRKYYFAENNIRYVPQKGSRLISFITGCALLFKPGVTGLLSEKFFFGEEDFEFSLRLKMSRLKMACFFDSVIYHKVGCTVNNIVSQKEKICLQYTMRLINLRDYQAYPVWIFSILLYLIYSFYLIVIKENIGIKFYVGNWMNILKYIRKYSEVNKDVFNEICALYQEK